MDAADAIRLFDYLSWSRDRILAAAAKVASDALTSEDAVTTRDLRTTLVHELDVECSWRGRLRGGPEADWGPESELRPEDFPTVAAIATRWSADELEMRRWISGLSAAVLSAPPPSERRTRLPLSDFLLHIVMHGGQQFSDAAVLLTRLGASPGDLEFLDFANGRNDGSTT